MRKTIAATGAILMASMLFSFCTRAQVALHPKLPTAFKFYRLADSSAFTSSDIGKNKKSLIILFDATCEHCQAELSAIGKRYKDFEKANLYLVSMDEKQQVEGFMSTFGKALSDKKNVTVLLDPDKQFMPNFMPERFPAIYVYSASQELTWHKDGQREIDEILAALKD